MTCVYSPPASAPVARTTFHLAGAALGQHVKALIPKADEVCDHIHSGCSLLSLMDLSSQSLLSQPGGLHIVAVGSVLLHCWDLLKDGMCTFLHLVQYCYENGLTHHT